MILGVAEMGTNFRIIRISRWQGKEGVIVLDAAMKIREPFTYNLEFDQERGDSMMKGYDALGSYGWHFENEEEAGVLDGTYEP